MASIAKFATAITKISINIAKRAVKAFEVAKTGLSKATAEAHEALARFKASKEAAEEAAEEATRKVLLIKTAADNIVQTSAQKTVKNLEVSKGFVKNPKLIAAAAAVGVGTIT